MPLFLRNLALACVGLMAMIGMMTAGVFVALLLLGAIILLWGFVALRKAGIIQSPKAPATPPQDPTIIEADYVVVKEEEHQIRQDKV